jgi:predicted nucleotidyltransferase
MVEEGQQENQQPTVPEQMDMQPGTSHDDDFHDDISDEPAPLTEEEVEFDGVQQQQMEEEVINAVEATRLEGPGQDEIMELARLKKERRKQQQNDYLKKKIEKMTEEEQKEFKLKERERVNNYRKEKK